MTMRISEVKYKDPYPVREHLIDRPDGHGMPESQTESPRAKFEMPDFKSEGRVTASDIYHIESMLRKMEIHSGTVSHHSESIESIERQIGVPLPSVGDSMQSFVIVVNRLTELLAKPLIGKMNRSVRST